MGVVAQFPFAFRANHAALLDGHAILFPVWALTNSPAPAAWMLSLLQLVMSSCPLVNPLSFLFNHAGIALLIYL